MRTRSRVAVAAEAAALHLPFLVAHPAWGPTLPERPAFAALRVLCVAFVLVLAPGWPLARLLVRRSAAVLTLALAISAGTLVLADAACVAAAGAPQPGWIWNALWIVAGAGTGILVRHPPRPLRVGAIPLAVFAGAFALYLYGATRVVPAMEDHDQEVLGTGHALLTRGEPLLLTDRDTTHFFAHPPLLHVWVAGSFLFHGRFERLLPYEAVSGAALGEPDAAKRRRLARDLNVHYLRHPERLAARTVNVFLAALAAACLASWLARESGSPCLGAGLAAAYATSPEVFVRSSYGGYFAVDALCVILSLSTARAWERRPDARTRGAAFLAGAVAALADHKLALLPLALALRALLLPPPSRPRSRALRHPAAWGFAAGVAAFAAWGLAIDARAFFEDHVRTHLVDRVLHVNPLGYAGYPSAPGLWLELARHTGYVLLPLALAAGLVCLRRPRPETHAWLLWILLTACAFTLVDWRMSKHLMPLLPGFFLLIAHAAQRSRAMTAAAALSVAILLLYNAAACRALATAFAAWRITPVW